MAKSKALSARLQSRIDRRANVIHMLETEAFEQKQTAKGLELLSKLLGVSLEQIDEHITQLYHSAKDIREAANLMAADQKLDVQLLQLAYDREYAQKFGISQVWVEGTSAADTPLESTYE